MERKKFRIVKIKSYAGQNKLLPMLVKIKSYAGENQVLFWSK